MEHNLSAILIDFQDIEMKNSEKLYEIINKVNEKYDIDAFVETEVVKGKTKFYFFIGFEFTKFQPMDKITKYMRSIKISLETNEILNVNKVHVFN